MKRRPPSDTHTTHSFPSRRASDPQSRPLLESRAGRRALPHRDAVREMRVQPGAEQWRDFMGKARSEEHTSELQTLMRISYAVFCLKKKKTKRRIIELNHSTQTQQKYLSQQAKTKLHTNTNK